MKALTYEGKEKIAYSTVKDPELLSSGDVIVKVLMSGLCGSDLHVYHGREKGLDCGTVMGHEFVGEIVDLGANIRNFKKGDIVISPFTTNCDSCYYCLIGLTCRCTKNQLYGWLEKGEGLHGGQAEYVRVPLADTSLLKLAEGLNLKEGILLGDNFPTGYYCAEQAEIKPDGFYVVLGCGAVGLMAVLSCFLLGAERVIAIDSVPERLNLAKGFGAQTINYKKVNCINYVLEQTSGRGADGVLEVVGSSEAARLAMDLVRPGGIISTVGVHTSSQFSFSPVEAYDKNLTFKIGRCPARFYMPKLMEKAKENKIDKLITHIFNLKEGEKAYDYFAKREDGLIKGVFVEKNGRFF